MKNYKKLSGVLLLTILLLSVSGCTWSNEKYLAEKFPTIPEELRENLFLRAHDEGMCKELLGDVGVAVIFVNDEISSWTEEEKQEIMTLHEQETELLENAAADYEKELQFHMNYMDAYVENVYENDETEEWLDEVLSAVNFPETKKIASELKDMYQVDEAAIFIYLNDRGRSQAIQGIYGNQFEYAMICDKLEGTFLHELLHLFGADDYYYPETVRKIAKDCFGESSMLSADVQTIDSLTAYLIGWTEDLAEDALLFLNETIEITRETMDEAYEEETKSGEGIREDDEGIYEGDLVEGFRHGQGTYTYNDGSSYTGEWKNDMIHGQGIYTYTDGSTYEGEWEEGIQHGQGTYTYTDGSTYEGEWKEGIQHGWGIYTFDDGSSYEGEWENGQFHGQGTYTYSDGSFYTGEWKNDLAHGWGIYKDVDGSSYEGEWENDLQNGQGTYTDIDGRTYTGTWEDGYLR